LINRTSKEFFTTMIVNPRLIKIIALSGRREKVPLNEVLTTHFRIWPADIHLSTMSAGNDAYFRFMDLARIDHWSRLGLFQLCVKKRWPILIGGQVIHYRRALRLFAAFSVTTRWIFWDEKWFYVKHEFIHKDRIVAIAFVKGLVRAEGRSLTPDEFLRRAGFECISPQKPMAVEEWDRVETEFKWGPT
jgi:acyl-CoA thioesterase FadM